MILFISDRLDDAYDFNQIYYFVIFFSSLAILDIKE